VLTQKCTLKCAYCCEGGEGPYSTDAFHNIALLKKRIKEVLEIGVKKIRLTGGEPFLYPNIEELLNSLLILKKKYNTLLLINTNATLPVFENYIEILKKLNAKVVVHLDTVREETYIKLNKSNKKVFFNVFENIKLLEENNLLHRFNVVITKYNIGEFDDLINFARKMKTNIKAFDITEVPNQFVNKNKIYSPLDKFIKNLERKSKGKFFHPYAVAYGTPVMIYDLGSLLFTIKYTKDGSRYSPEICKNCQFFPCDEGLYDLLYYPDDTLWACRWKRPNILKNDFKQDLKILFRIYQQARWFIGNKFIE